MHGAHGGKALRQPATDFLLLRKRQSIDIYIHAHMHYMCGRGGICTYAHMYMYVCINAWSPWRKSSSPVSYRLFVPKGEEAD